LAFEELGTECSKDGLGLQFPAMMKKRQIIRADLWGQRSLPKKKAACSFSSTSMFNAHPPNNSSPSASLCDLGAFAVNLSSKSLYGAALTIGGCLTI
jgi:hypothetical protein